MVRPIDATCVDEAVADMNDIRTCDHVASDNTLRLSIKDEMAYVQRYFIRGSHDEDNGPDIGACLASVLSSSVLPKKQPF